MKLQRFVLLIIELVAIVSGARLEKRRPVKAKVINFRSKYYQSQFSLCKPFRHLNPVESVKAHRLATDIFRRYGPQLVVPFITAYNMPAFAIYKLSEIFCFGITVTFARIANDGGVTAPENTSYTEIFQQVNMLNSLFLSPDVRLLARHRDKIFRYQQIGLNNLISNITQCAINEEHPPQRELDYYKHTINHFLALIL